MSKIEFVQDNNGRYFIIDPVTQTRYETGGAGSGSYGAAMALYGAPRQANTELTGWNEHPTGAVGFFGGPNKMEMVVSGRLADPFTGQLIGEPQSIVSGNGQSYSALPRDGVTTGQATSTPSGKSAKAQTEALLKEYDLEELIPFVDEWVKDNLSGPRIVQEMRGSDPYKKRFPGMQLRTDGNLAAINESEYINLERSYRNIFRTAGLPPGFYDSPEDFTQFIASDISPSEAEERVTQGILAAKNAPPEVSEALASFYGIQDSDAALTAYYLDPEKALPAIEREFQSATIAGVAKQTGFNELGQSQAEELQALGINEAQARQGFSQLGASKEFLTAGINEAGGETFSTQQKLDAQFKQDSELMERIRRQRERRDAVFSGKDSGAAGGKQGLTGLRSTNT